MAVTFQVIGFKKSGKTAVVEAATQALADKGLTVAVLKHNSHDASMDVPGTDTDRFSHAGAATTVLVSENGVFTHQQNVQPTAADLIAQLPTNPDVVLVEGFKEADYPKLAMLRAGDNATDFAGDTNVALFGSLTVHIQAQLTSLEAITEWLVDRITKEVSQHA